MEEAAAVHGWACSSREFILALSFLFFNMQFYYYSVAGSAAIQIFSYLKLSIKSNLFFLFPFSLEIYQIILCFRFKLFMEINRSDPL